LREVMNTVGKHGYTHFRGACLRNSTPV
jgi:hypothetical protein